jgi:hypothetical protein
LLIFDPLQLFPTKASNPVSAAPENAPNPHPQRIPHDIAQSCRDYTALQLAGKQRALFYCFINCFSVETTFFLNDDIF